MTTETGESGLLTSVYWEWLGTELSLDAAQDATVIFVRNPAAVSPNEEFWISETGPYRVLSVDGEAVTLETGLVIPCEESEPVVPDMGGEPGQAWYAEVILPDAEEPIEVPMTWQDRLLLPEGEYEPPRAIVLSGDLQRIVDVPYQTPTVQYGSITDPPDPNAGSGSAIYPQDDPPWPNGTPDQPHGDMWIETDNDMHKWFWDSASMLWIDANDPDLDLLDDISQLPIGEGGPTLGEIANTVENTSQVATSARNLASTADGRVSMSDYDPVPEDSRYYATDTNGDLLRGPSFSIVGVELTGGIATITQESDNLQMGPGEYVVITGVGAPFDGTWTVQSEDPLLPKFTYRITGQADIAPIDLTLTPGTGYNTVILDRIEGSVWFTRTRSRKNLVTNPSFEVDMSGWAVANCTATRVDVDTYIGGDYVMRLVNDAVAQDHRAEWAGGAPGMAVEQGQTYAVTCFGLLEAGQDPLVLGVGCYASVRFYRSDGSFYSEVNGEAVTLQVPGELAGPEDDDWREMKVTATVPTPPSGLPVTMMSAVVLHNPNASAVWYVDGALVEQAEYTGRYFDGDSYDAIWGEEDPTHPGVKPGLGIPHQTFSTMFGGKIISVFELYDGDWVPLDFTGTTQYDADAADLTKGFLNPDRIEDRSLDPEKFKTNVVIASETLDAGDFVNVWTSGAGAFLLRKADATQQREAHGFILNSAVAGNAVPVFTVGYNPLCSGLAPGVQFLSTTPGKAQNIPPQTAGRIVQEIGFASDPTTLHFAPQPPVLLN